VGTLFEKLSSLYLNLSGKVTLLKTKTEGTKTALAAQSQDTTLSNKNKLLINVLLITTTETMVIQKNAARPAH